MEANPSPCAELKKAEVEVSLVFRHFHPILAGAAERFRRYSVPLSGHGVGYEVFTLREDMAHPDLENMHDALRVRRICAEGKPWQRDAVLFEAASRHLATLPPKGHVLQTSLAHDLSRPWLRRIRNHGTGCLYVGTMVGREDNSLPAWRRLVQKCKAWMNYQPFHRVVASTTVMARWFQSQGVSAERIQVIPNGVDLKRFRPLLDASEKLHLRSRLGLEGTAPVVLFAGSIVPRKGVDLLLQAWPSVLAQVPDARLVLVGGFDRPTFMTRERMQELSRFQEDMRSLAVREECRGSVTFAGESPHVEEWMRASDVFVFPTEQEGMGNVVLEAMASAVPCVITDFHGLPQEEFGTSGREFQLLPRTKEDLSRGLVELLGSTELARRMGAAGLAWARKHMDLNLVVERYAKLYKALAGQN